MENCNGQMDCTLSNEPMEMDSDNQQKQRSLACCPNCGNVGNDKVWGMTGYWELVGDEQDNVEVHFHCEKCMTHTTAMFKLTHIFTEAI